MRVSIPSDLLLEVLLAAERDRSTYADADPGPAGTEALEVAARVRALRLRLFGPTAHEVAVGAATSVSLRPRGPDGGFEWA